MQGGVQRTQIYMMAPSTGEAFAGGFCFEAASVTLELYMRYPGDFEDIPLHAVVAVQYHGGCLEGFLII